MIFPGIFVCDYSISITGKFYVNRDFRLWPPNLTASDRMVTHNLSAPRGEICGGLALTERPESSSILATGSNTGAILVWRLNDALVPVILPGHVGNIQDTKIYNGFIISFGEDGTVRVWDLDSGACLYILGGHVGWISSEFLDLRRIATLDVEGQLRVWSLENGYILNFPRLASTQTIVNTSQILSCQTGATIRRNFLRALVHSTTSYISRQ
jgi:WD40 repeat protein